MTRKTIKNNQNLSDIQFIYENFMVLCEIFMVVIAKKLWCAAKNIWWDLRSFYGIKTKNIWYENLLYLGQ